MDQTVAADELVSRDGGDEGGRGIDHACPPFCSPLWYPCVARGSTARHHPPEERFPLC